MSKTRTCAGPCKQDLPIVSFRPDRRTCRSCESKARVERRRKARNSNPWANYTEFEKDEELFSVDWDSVIPFGLPIERACAESLLMEGGVVDAAEALQLEPRQLRAHLSELQRRAATRGWSPGCDMRNTVPEGFHVKGVSTYYRTNDDGSVQVRGQWVKSKRDEEAKYAALLDAMSGIADAWKGKAEPIAAPSINNEDLLAIYPMGDPHLGMLAWPAETGNKFDLTIAEQTLFGAVDKLVGLAPPAKHALIINLGDFFHADNKGSTTTRGTPVDVDGRWPKVLATGVRVMRRIIDRALEKHERVTVICEIGNHDDHSSIMLSIALAQFYEREPRVTIDTSPEPFHWYRFGKNLIGVHHGDKVKRDALGEVMACDRAKDWGETDHRYWYIGHVHHDTLKELRGVTVESFRTLAARDAWHHGQGYRSGRDMKLDIVHRLHGKIDRHIVGIGQLYVPD